MQSTGEYLAEANEKIKQLERRRALQDSKKRKAQEKNEVRRQLMIGQIFLDVFPEFLQLQPQYTSVDNKKEFAPLREYLTAMSRDEKLVYALKEITSQHD